MKPLLVLSICLLLTAPQAISGTIAVSSEKAPSQFIPGTVVYGNSFGIDEADRLAKEGVFIGKDSKDNFIDLAYGNILLIPDKDITVSTRISNIRINAGAVVFIMESGNGLAVYDLGQPPSKQVAVIIGKFKFIMQPGRMLALGLNCRSISYSNVHTFDLPNLAVNTFVADFSIPSALFNIEPLKRLATSNNNQDRLVLQKIMQNNQNSKPALVETLDKTH